MIAEKLTGKYAVSKTIRFKLEPVGKTKEWMEKDGIVDKDCVRASESAMVCDIIDRVHRHVITDTMQGISHEQPEVLSECVQSYLDVFHTGRMVRAGEESAVDMLKKAEEEQEKQCNRAGKYLASRLSEHPEYSLVTKEYAKLFKSLDAYAETEEEHTMIASFKGFTGYFSKYFTARAILYSDWKKHGSVAHRVICDNMPIHAKNMELFAGIQKMIPEQLNTLQTELQGIGIQMTLKELFSTEHIAGLLTPDGIKDYNTVLSGWTTADRKVRGLNEYINLYNQQTDGIRLAYFQPLYKLILMEKDTYSVIPERFSTDEELLDAVSLVVPEILETLTRPEEGLLDTLKGIYSYNSEDIYIDSGKLSFLSHACFGDYSLITAARESMYDNEHGTGEKKTKKYKENRKKILQNEDRISLAQLNRMIRAYTGNTCHLEDYFFEQTEQIEQSRRNYQAYLNVMKRSEQSRGIRRNEDYVNAVISLFDGLLALNRIVNVFAINKEVSAGLFMNRMEEVAGSLKAAVELHGKVRTYITAKPYSKEKVELCFDSPTFLNGWDADKRYANRGHILLKDEQYYFAVSAGSDKRCLQDAPDAKTDTCYKQMVYKQLSKISMNLPRCIFSEKNKELFCPTDEIIRIYKNGTFKQGDNFSREDMLTLISYFKECLAKWEVTRNYEFHFSDMEAYHTIADFYGEVDAGAYRVSFQNVDADYVDSLVSDGRLYLFRLARNDLNKQCKNAVYLKCLAEPCNANGEVVRLTGGAQMFYRKASIEDRDKVIHRHDVPIANKNPDNEKKNSIFPYDIIKDRRFTLDSFSLHLTFTINPGRKQSNINSAVISAIQDETESVNVLGVTRGENNLIYVTVTDWQGHILEQKSLDVVTSYDPHGGMHVFDYCSLLDRKENERKKNQQKWKNTEGLKTAKEGFLSQIVPVISNMMLKYNAILVTERFADGFVQSRQKIDKQIYNKFIEMMVNKLNFMITDRDIHNTGKAGTVWNGYQLANEFSGIQDIGFQSGMMFFVSPMYTTQIDPTTGFVNKFKTQELRKKEDMVNFLQSFKKIIYNSEAHYFEFSFDYKDFGYERYGKRSEWTVCSHGKRVTYTKTKTGITEIKWESPTELLIKLFEDNDINFESGNNLLDDILAVNQAGFYQELIKLFQLTVTMKNKGKDTKNAVIISPVKNANGEFFVSGAVSGFPDNADANASYSMCRYGSLILEKIIKGENRVYVTVDEWLESYQS